MGLQSSGRNPVIAANIKPGPTLYNFFWRIHVSIGITSVIIKGNYVANGVITPKKVLQHWPQGRSERQWQTFFGQS
jgi:hypothetical protein